MALLQTVIVDGQPVGEVRTATRNSVMLCLNDAAPEFLRRLQWRYPTTRSAMAAVEAAIAAEKSVAASPAPAPEPQPEPEAQPSEPAPAPATRTRRNRKAPQ